MRPEERADAAGTDGSAETLIHPGEASASAETLIHPGEASASAETLIHPGEASASAETLTDPADARPNPARLSVGNRFGGFVVEAEIARGEMGIVYRVKRVRLNRTEALKVIAPKYSDDPAFRARFQREAMNAAIADHPHVVRVYDAGETDGLHYMAMQYVDGVDLRQMQAQQGRLPASMAAEITRQVGSALDAAHANGLIHRDVKPANILIAGPAAARHAYLSDFGVSRQLAALSDLTLPGTVVGTPHYSSPEQHLGRQVDHRSDVYSLGCVLYEMLTGSKPYNGDSVTAVAIAHCEQPTPLVRDANPALPAALDLVVARAMAKNPDERYQSAGELGAAAIAASREGVTPEAEVSVDEIATRVDRADAVREDPIPIVPAPATDDETATRIGSAPPQLDAADGRPGERARPRGRRSVAIVIAALIAVAVVIAAVVILDGGGTAISAQVISPVGANVRLSPVKDGDVNAVAHLRSGAGVTVSCNVTGGGGATGWDRLHAPYPGRYVAADLLKPQKPVPRCS